MYELLLVRLIRVSPSHTLPVPLHRPLSSPPSQDEPLTPDDDVDRQLRTRKQQQPSEEESAEIEAASFKKFPVEVNSLARVSY